MPDQLTFSDYLKAAARHRPRIPGMGRMPLHQLGLAAFGVLGLANPGFWLLGAAAEVAYLFAMASSERFQKLVRGERLLAKKETHEARIGRVISRLSAASQSRYRNLLERSREILSLAETLDDDPLGLRPDRAGSLNQLLWIFLRLLASREIVQDTLERTDRADLERDLARLEAQIAEEEAEHPDSALVRSLRGTLEIQQRRLDNLAKAERSARVIDAELERIEQQVRLLREETAVGGKAEALSSRLDAVTGTLSETNRFLEQHADLFGSLGADPLGSAPAELPEMPPPPPALETEG